MEWIGNVHEGSPFNPPWAWGPHEPTRSKGLLEVGPVQRLVGDEDYEASCTFGILEKGQILEVDGVRMQRDPSGLFLLPALPPVSKLSRESYVKVLDPTVDLSYLRDRRKIVVVRVTSRQVQGLDLHRTHAGTIPGVHLNALVLNALLQGTLIKTPSLGGTVLVAFVLYEPHHQGYCVGRRSQPVFDCLTG